MEVIPLNGSWTLRRVRTGETYPARIPGVVHTDLLAAGVIERPYYGDNERKYIWIANEDWSYSRKFQVGPEFLAGRAHRLTCEGLDTFATAILNGTVLGRTENMFRRYEFDPADLLVPGENEIEIVFASPLARGAELAAALRFPIPYTEMWKGIIPGDSHRNLVRKCQCHYGWDWGPAFPTAGIWRDITLVSYDRLKIDYVQPIQEHEGERVLVRVRIHVDAALAGDYEIAVSLAGSTAAGRFNLPPGRSRVELALELDRPEMWWPAGYGPQTLHELEVAIAAGGIPAAAWRGRVGLRRVELVREKDGSGEGFYFRINGVPVYLKGYNWIPVDCFTAGLSRESYADLLASVAAANCNALRVWGGGIYEDEAFYDLCDELGLLVWQDFMFACAMYPWDEEFLANVEAEAIHQLRRLARHPSVVLWCGNNENEGALNWYEESRTNRDRYLAGYHLLYLHTLGRLAAAERPDLPYWPSSPCNGPEEYGDDRDPNRGDTHFWEVWHSGKGFEAYLAVTPRLVTEFGFQSLPSLETLAAVMAPEDLNISSAAMDRRQRSPRGNQKIVAHLMHEYRLPGDFAGLVYLSQVQQAEGMRMAVEHWRRRKPVNMGALIWQLNDVWPGQSWSAIEYGGKWKILHFAAGRFFAPILLSLAKDAEGVAIWGTNDLIRTAAGSFVLEVRDFDGGIIRRWRKRYELPAGESRQLLTLPYAELAGEEDKSRFFLVLRGEDGENGIPLNWTFLAPAKCCPLAKAAITCTAAAAGADTEITLRTDRPAFFVWLEAPGRRGRFSDNGFLLLPDRPATVRFAPTDNGGPLPPDGIKITHLAGVV